MDLTNWQWGKANLNFLVLSACYKGVAIPLYWLALNKKGNSDTGERILLINRFIVGFGREKILGLLADREFVGKEWFAYLIKMQIPFDMRTAIPELLKWLDITGAIVTIDVLGF